MDIRRRIGQNVKQARLALPISQEALALGAAIDRTYISTIERGAANPSAILLERIAGQLNVDVRDLLAPLPKDTATAKNLRRGRNVHHQGRKLGVKRRKRST